MILRLLQRLVVLVTSLVVASLVVFGFMRVLPGDPARVALGVNASDAAVAQLREQFGSLLDPLLQDRSVCIAGSLPAALTLDSIEVVDAELVAGFAIDGGIIQDPALQANGAC